MVGRGTEHRTEDGVKEDDSTGETRRVEGLRTGKRFWVWVYVEEFRRSGVRDPLIHIHTLEELLPCVS